MAPSDRPLNRSDETQASATSVSCSPAAHVRRPGLAQRALLAAFNAPWWTYVVVGTCGLIAAFALVLV